MYFLNTGTYQTALVTNQIYKQVWLKYKKYISSHIKLGPAIQTENDIENCVDKINNLLLS